MKIITRIFITVLFWLLFTGCSSMQNFLSDPVADAPALPSTVTVPVQAEEESAAHQAQATSLTAP